MNVAEMMDEERRLVLEAPVTHGAFFQNALDGVFMLSTLATVTTDPVESFLRFHVQAKNHLLLALFSTVRRHRTQAKMNLRLFLEGTLQAAYALAHKDLALYFDLDEMKSISHEKIVKRAKKWLTEKYPASSESILDYKSQINGQSAHANFWSSHTNFRHDPKTMVLELPFFDLQDDEAIQVELNSIATMALVSIDLMMVVNEEFGGVTLPESSHQRWSNIHHRNVELRGELAKSPRWIAAAASLENPEANAKPEAASD